MHSDVSDVDRRTEPFPGAGIAHARHPGDALAVTTIDTARPVAVARCGAGFCGSGGVRAAAAADVSSVGHSRGGASGAAAVGDAGGGLNASGEIGDGGSGGAPDARSTVLLLLRWLREPAGCLNTSAAALSSVLFFFLFFFFLLCFSCLWWCL